MSFPCTLSELVGLDLKPCSLSESALLIVDCQNTYFDGPMKLAGVEAAASKIASLLARAREEKTPVIHIAHDAGEGSLYDVKSESGAIASQATPQSDEPLVVKNYPNSFTQTDLHDRLQKLGVANLIVVGFMTHMCVSSTVRGAFDLGYRSTVVGNATATRDLPTSDGRIVESQNLHIAALSGLSDLVATVVTSADELPD